MSLLLHQKKGSNEFQDRTPSVSSENIPEVNKSQSEKGMRGFVCFSFYLSKWTSKSVSKRMYDIILELCFSLMHWAATEMLILEAQNK